MIIITTIRMAIRALQRNTLRTLLTMLGIIIGVGAVIAMISIGNGARAQIESQIASLGQNVILVMSGNFTRGGMGMGFGSAGTLTKEDFDAIGREVIGVSGASPEVRGSAQVAAGNQNVNTSIIGGSEDYAVIRSWTLTSGANFNDQDVRSANKVALLGQTTAATLFGDGEAVGQIIRIKNAPFAVVGVLGAKGSDARGNDQDDIIIIPWTSAMKRITGGTTFRSISVQAMDVASSPQVQSDLNDLLRQRHRISEGKEDDFTIRSQQEIADFATASTKVMTVLLGSIAGVSLLVGGIGIMNIMLVSVTERTREIGVRMAIGARGQDILLQFLIEAVVLSVVGGGVGVVFGVAGSYAVAKTQNWTTLVSTSSVVLSFLTSAGIGIFFGFYPARKAAQLDPIEALRFD